MAEQVKQSTIKLRSADGEAFEVQVDVARVSATLRTMMDDLDDDEEIPIQNVSSSILRKVLQWANHHKPDSLAPEAQEEEPRRVDDISAWDADFLNVDQATLFEIIDAATYLDIKDLRHMATTTVANMIRGKSADEIREAFNIVNDFTPSEMEEVKREMEWCMD